MWNSKWQMIWWNIDGEKMDWKGTKQMNTSKKIDCRYLQQSF